MLKLRSAILLTIGGLALLGSAKPAQAQVLSGTDPAPFFIIDDFLTSQEETVSVSVPAGADPVTDGNSVETLTSIGGERDLWVEKISGAGGQDVQSEINPVLGDGINLLNWTIELANGSIEVVWDGVDGDPDTTDFDGLNFLSGAENPLEDNDFSEFSFLEFSVQFSDLGGPIEVTFYDGDDPTGNTFASTVITIPGTTTTGEAVLPDNPVFVSQSFDEFTATGATFEDIIDNVGAIELVINAEGAAQTSWDGQIDLIQLSGVASADPDPSETVPEPSSILALFALGLMGAGSTVKKRSK